MNRVFPSQFKKYALGVFFALVTLGTFASRSNAQASASISGTITDQSRAVVGLAVVTVKNLETGAIRTINSNASGSYLVLSLLPGPYEVSVIYPGFKAPRKPRVDLSVGEEARLDVMLYVAAADVGIEVKSDLSVVNTSTSDISGLVGAQQVKDLPLNGRSYDLLLPLNPGIVNFTSQKTGGNGISNSTTANNFSVSGNRPQQNLFLLNGVEYTGAAENNMTPGGTSGMLLGVDAVREFNVQRDSYGAEFGKKPGGQVIIVTQSGTNQLHGALFEFLRNNALDAPNFFDRGDAPPFQRNQFGASLGGPLRKDKTFAFGNYEGFRQHLHQTSAAFVPDLTDRAAAVPSVQPLLNLWPTPTATDLDFPGGCTPPTTLPSDACGIAEVFSSPLQTIREDFGTARVDHIFSQKDTLGTIYTV